MRTYTEQELISFGEFLMKAANHVIRENTRMKPLDNKTGPKLVRDLFRKWENDNEPVNKIYYMKGVIEEWGAIGNIPAEVDGEECPMFSGSKDDHWIVERIDVHGIEIGRYIHGGYVTSTDVEWKAIGDEVLSEVCRIVENYEAICLQTEKRISD